MRVSDAFHHETHVNSSQCGFSPFTGLEEALRCGGDTRKATQPVVLGVLAPAVLIQWVWGRC